MWGNSSPSTPYTVTQEGKGPAWSNSLFEDNAEFGYGIDVYKRQTVDATNVKNMKKILPYM